MIQHTIGYGSLGAVYLARDLMRQTNCAIKEMNLSMVPAEDRAQAVQNFKAEAKMLAGLNHPNLPTFSGFFTEGTRHFLVMEFIDGMTLDAFQEHNHGPFPERRVLMWAKQICDVLTYLHIQHPPIIFRDMKPGNIMLMRNGRIKLIDFGFARFFKPGQSQDTRLLGTLGFAPPEQYGHAQSDVRSDIYALAMTLFQLLTNTLPERGFGLKDECIINPQISLAVAYALEKATELKPQDRYQNVAAFCRAILKENSVDAEERPSITSNKRDPFVDMQYSSPRTTLVIILGASEWPHFDDFLGSIAYANSAKQLRSYFLNPKEFGVRSENLLDLFNSNASASDVEEQISKFLEQRITAMKDSGEAATDLLTYFVGHGGFDVKGFDYYLAIRRTRQDNSSSSGLRMADLAYTLKEKARYLRRILILDCCFAGAAQRYFQGAPAQTAIRQTITAFEIPGKGQGFARRGTSLLCSSGSTLPSVILHSGRYTLFTYAFLRALKKGLPTKQERLSLREMLDLTVDMLRAMPDDSTPHPELHSPDQREGDVADIPLFPNAAHDNLV